MISLAQEDAKMASKKVCPKCQTEMTASQSQAVLPSQLDTALADQATAFSLKIGLPVQPYYCPKCRYVEMYYSPA
jgi:DNA-directed RNA polymerase subunit M/transcription elongation factor TFIIS